MLVFRKGIGNSMFLGIITAENTRCYWFKVKCPYCRDLMVLCLPRKMLEVNLQNHLGGLKHQKAVLDSQVASTQPAWSGRLGRPSKSTNNSSQSNQGDLHSWFVTPSSSGLPGISSCAIASIMCYGFRGPIVEYGGNSYPVESLLNDRHCGVLWYPEPHLRAKIDIQGQAVLVSGAFCDIHCSRLSVSREPFPNLTCSMYALIPVQNDFRMRIRREEHALIKRGHRSAASGIRLGYLSAVEVCKHTRSLSRKLRLEKLHYSHATTRIAQLKAKRPTLRESANNASSDDNLIKFCNNIISAHRIGAFGGKPALWDFLKDVAPNLNRKDQGN